MVVAVAVLGKRYVNGELQGLLEDALRTRPLVSLRLVTSDDQVDDLLALAPEAEPVRILDYSDRRMPGASGAVAALVDRGAVALPPPKAVGRWQDKGLVQGRLLLGGVTFPQTVLISAGTTREHLASLSELVAGWCLCVVKPAIGSGAAGVEIGECSPQWLQRRALGAMEDLLLQRFVAARQGPDGWPDWFRVFYCDGVIVTTRWDPSTHASTLVPNVEEVDVMVQRIAAVTQYGLFSSEVAVQTDGQAVVIDPNNHKPMLRSVAEVGEIGVPGAVLRAVVDRLAANFFAAT